MNRKKHRHIISILCVAAFLFLAFASEDKPDSPLSDSSRITAYHFAEDFVKQELKMLNGVEFPSTEEKEEHTLELGNYEFLIDSWVDLFNEVGYSSRSEFSCKIIFIDEKASVENLIINKPNSSISDNSSSD